jgi:Flp pilus assembly protein TadG
MMSRRLIDRVMDAAARLAADDGGSYAIEFAFILPLLIALFFGIYEFGQAIWTQGILDYAVEQAARCATINTTTCDTNAKVQTFAALQTTPLNLPTTTFTVSKPTCGNQVTASYVFTFVGRMAIINGNALFPTSVTLTSSSCYPI